MAPDRRSDDAAEQDRLRRGLTAAAVATDEDGPAGGPAGLADVTRRARIRARRRQRSLAAAAVVALLAGTAGGFLFARSTGDAEEVRAVDDLPAGYDAGPAVSVPAEVDLPTVPAPEGGAAGGALAEIGGGFAEDIADTDEVRRAPAASYAVDASGGGSWWYLTEPMAPMFTRTLGDGTVLDVRGNRYPDGWGWQDDVPFWDPAAWCFPAGSVYVGVRTPEAVGQVGGQRYDEIRQGTMSLGTAVVGVPEGSPRWVVVVQVEPAATLVRAAFPDGRTDETEPIEGMVVLSGPVAEGHDPGAGPGGGGSQQGDLVVEVLAGTDRTAEYRGDFLRWHGSGLLDEAGNPADPWTQQECVAPTQLPEPGPEQPVDPEAARAEIEAAWTRLSTGIVDLAPSELDELLDDPAGVADATERLRDSGILDSVGPVSLPLREVVFADGATAWIRYSIEVGYGTFQEHRFGEVRFLDGTWRITRDTVCSLFAVGGTRCE